MLPPSVVTLPADDVRPRVAPAPSTRLCARTHRAARRAARVTSPDPRARAFPPATAATDADGPAALDLAFAYLEGVATGARHRPTRDGHRMAPPRLPPVVRQNSIAAHRSQLCRAESLPATSRVGVCHRFPPGTILLRGTRRVPLSRCWLSSCGMSRMPGITGTFIRAGACDVTGRRAGRHTRFGARAPQAARRSYR